MQLKTQVEYVVATGAVPTGTRLPSVRALSKHLGVAVDTVRQAYEELGKAGLVVTHRGAGTFTTLPDTDGGEVASTNTDWARADRALVDLIRTGVAPHQAAKAMAQRLALLHLGIDVAFIGVAASSARYAELISQYIPSEFGRVHAINLEELRNTPEAVDFGGATYALSLPFHLREVEQLVSDRPIRVLTVMSRLDAGLLADVPDAGSTSRPVLVARPSTRPIYVDLLTAQRPDLADLPFADAADEDAIAALLERTAVVLHTSETAGVVGRLAGSHHTLVELRHVPQEKSLDQLVRTLESDRELMLEFQRLHVEERRKAYEV
ncbi:hypothetical protein GCM10022205_06970 [Spinactinospora alkalitolerans]